jgi:hypothetical protein
MKNEFRKKKFSCVVRRRSFFQCCLPFGGFCGFSFHLENILNDTHLLNMLSSPFLRDERKAMNEKDEK